MSAVGVLGVLWYSGTFSRAEPLLAQGVLAELYRERAIQRARAVERDPKAALN
jgi:hypothetical protein